MPGSPLVRSRWSLTGRRRHRVGWGGRLVLQVEELSRTGTAEANGPHYTGEEARWRDAVAEEVICELTTEPVGLRLFGST